MRQWPQGPCTQAPPPQTKPALPLANSCDLVSNHGLVGTLHRGNKRYSYMPLGRHLAGAAAPEVTLSCGRRRLRQESLRATVQQRSVAAAQRRP